MIINYEELAQSYTESLTTVLRGFKPTVDFLETWVHDEDPVRSILSLIESAEEGQIPEVILYLGPKTLKTLDLEQLKSLTQKLGRITTKSQGEGLSFQVSFRRDS